MFNFDVPSNAEDYVHRIGRTGRAGREGKAFTFAMPSYDDKRLVSAVEDLIGAKITLLEGAVPDEASKSKKPAKSAKKSKPAIEKSEANEAAVPEIDDAQADKAKPETPEGKAEKPKAERAPKGQKPQKADANRNEHGELRPVAWTGGNSFKDSADIPAFLRSA